MAASEDRNRLDREEQTQDSELEQYGVWVKAGPEDVDENDAEDEAFALTDLGDEELEEAEIDLLAADEQEPDFTAADDISLDLDEPEDTLSIDEDESESTDDFAALDLEEETVSEAPAAPEPAFTEPTEEEELDDLLTLEEDDMTLDLDEETEELGLDTEIDLEEPEPLAAEPLDLQDEPDGPGESASAGGIDIEDELPGDLDDLTLDLDSLDVDSFAEVPAGQQPEPEPEQTLPAADEDAIGELDELDEAEAINLDSSELNLEEDDLDLESLGLDDDTEVTELDLSSLPGEEEEDFGTISTDDLGQPVEDDLPELEIDDEIDIEDELSFDEGFDDIGAVEEEMTTPTEPAPVQSAAVQTDSTGDDRSFSLLESIERELTSIRGELTGLKQELSQLRSQPSAPDAAATPAPISTDEDEAGSGFFEDETDDDETIALTGAELDNIMSTAEFTEETGQPTDLDDLAGIAAEGELDLDLIGESSEDHPVQEITLDEAPEDLGTLDLDLSGIETSDEPVSEDEAADASLAAPDSDANVEALASMDIDAELAGIEELEDMSGEAAATADAPRIDTTEEEPIGEDLIVDDDDLILDAEPLEAEPLDAEPLEAEPVDAEPLEAEPEPLSETEEPLLEDEPRDEIRDELIEAARSGDTPIPENLKGELRSVLNYMDKLLDSLPEEKIQEFAASDHFKVYKRLFEELGLEQ